MRPVPVQSNGGKLAINRFVGLLGKAHVSNRQVYFESDYDAIVGQVFANDNVELKGIYSECYRFASANLLSPQDGELNEIIKHAAENPTDPIMYQIGIN